MRMLIFVASAVFYTQAIWAVEAQAILQWSHRVELSTPNSGIVRAVNVELGDQVKKGQILLTLDSAIFQARVAEKMATIMRLAAEVEEAMRDFNRVRELHTRTVVATAELDQARLRLTRAESMLAEARANLKIQQKILDDSSIRAPLDAVVIYRQAEPGMSIASGLQLQTLLVLAKSGEMIARLLLNATQIEKLKVGQTLLVSLRGEKYSGKIHSLGLEPVTVKEESGYQVDVVFPTKSPLRAGLAAVVTLP